MDDLLPRADISAQLGDPIALLGSANWKERKEGLDAVEAAIAAAGGRIQANVGRRAGAEAGVLCGERGRCGAVAGGPISGSRPPSDVTAAAETNRWPTCSPRSRRAWRTQTGTWRCRCGAVGGGSDIRPAAVSLRAVAAASRGQWPRTPARPPARDRLFPARRRWASSQSWRRRWGAASGARGASCWGLRSSASPTTSPWWAGLPCFRRICASLHTWLLAAASALLPRAQLLCGSGSPSLRPRPRTHTNPLASHAAAGARRGHRHGRGVGGRRARRAALRGGRGGGVPARVLSCL